MPRKSRDYPIETRAARLNFAVRREPYWRSVQVGVSIGYRRLPEGRAGTWIARRYDAAEGRTYQALGPADDLPGTDGAATLTFEQAQARAVAWFQRSALAQHTGEASDLALPEPPQPPQPALDETWRLAPAAKLLCRRAADRIAGGTVANENLVRAVEAAALRVGEALEAKGADISRSDARARLTQLCKLAERIARILDDKHLGMFLPMLQPGGRDDVKITSERMRRLADDACFCRENIHGGGGSTSLRDTVGAARGRLVCAVAVYRLWQMVRGRFPGKNSENAKSACDLIWQAAGQPEGEEAFNGWERYLKDVRKATKRGFDDRQWHAWMLVGDILRDAGLAPSEDGQNVIRGPAYSDEGEEVPARLGGTQSDENIGDEVP
jgi:hypothetical protein